MSEKKMLLHDVSALRTALTEALKERLSPFAAEQFDVEHLLAQFLGAYHAGECGSYELGFFVITDKTFHKLADAHGIPTSEIADMLNMLRKKVPPSMAKLMVSYNDRQEFDVQIEVLGIDAVIKTKGGLTQYNLFRGQVKDYLEEGHSLPQFIKDYAGVP